MPVTLVVLAAGLGTRFRGTKQLAEVTPSGETLFDLTIEDAVHAGAEHVVMIVRRDIEGDVRDHVSRRHPRSAVSYVCQDAHGPPRGRPWGTAHAVLTAAPVIPGPFVVANADDYYGPSSVAGLVRAAADLPPDRALLAAFHLERTLPREGAVSRAICIVDGDELVEVTETHGIARGADGAIHAEGSARPLAPDAMTSMNLWGFPYAILGELAGGFERFLRDHGDDPTSEYVLPDVVHDLMADGTLRVGVIPTDEAWTGITNPDDLETTRRRLALLRPPG